MLGRARGVYGRIKDAYESSGGSRGGLDRRGLDGRCQGDSSDDRLRTGLWLGWPGRRRRSLHLGRRQIHGWRRRCRGLRLPGAWGVPTPFFHRTPLRATPRTGFPRVAGLGSSRRLGRQNPIPVELDVRVLLLKQPNGVLIKRRATDLDVRWGSEPVQELRLVGTGSPPGGVQEVRALVAAPIARKSQSRHALLALGDRPGRVASHRLGRLDRADGRRFGRRLGFGRDRSPCGFGHWPGRGDAL